MRQSDARCHRLELIGARIRVHFDSDLIPAPGQFALARLADTFDPYLRRSFFPSAIAASGFAVDLDARDPALRLLSPGAVIDLVGPAGLPARDLLPRSRVLLIADQEPAFLLPFASRSISTGGAVTLLLSDPYPLDALDPEIELRVGDLKTLAAEFVPTADLVFIHTDPALHRSLHQTFAEARVVVPPDLAFALLAPPMPCGTGACGACAVKAARGWKLACADGPFFSLADLET